MTTQEEATTTESTAEADIRAQDMRGTRERLQREIQTLMARSPLAGENPIGLPFVFDADFLEHVLLALQTMAAYLDAETLADLVAMRRAASTARGRSVVSGTTGPWSFEMAGAKVGPGMPGDSAEHEEKCVYKTYTAPVAKPLSADDPRVQAALANLPIATLAQCRHGNGPDVDCYDDACRAHDYQRAQPRVQALANLPIATLAQCRHGNGPDVDCYDDACRAHDYQRAQR